MTNLMSHFKRKNPGFILWAVGMISLVSSRGLFPEFWWIFSGSFRVYGLGLVLGPVAEVSLCITILIVYNRLVVHGYRGNFRDCGNA
jgi:hypothetical protein